jgi:hypothetical protein
MLADRVLQTSTTTGTGTYDLIDPPTAAFLSAVAAVGSGNRLTYAVELGTSWEICWGVVTAGSPATLTRNLIRSSTGSLINWGAGTKTVYSISQADVLRFAARGAVPLATGTGNAQVVTHATPLRLLLEGAEVRFLAVAANTGATTLNVDGLGAIALVAPAGGALVGGELVINRMTSAIYDGTSWRLTDLPMVPQAITSTSGGNWTLPSGGRWGYFVVGFTTATGVWNTQTVSGQATGGSVIINAAGVTFTGLAWRVS